MCSEPKEVTDNPHVRRFELASAEGPVPFENQSEERHCITGRELELAARIHESLLPHPVRHPRIEIDIHYVPVSGVGGDYCQVLFPDESSCCISICDVTGHGLGPALLATRVSSEVRKLTYEGRRPYDILQKLNGFLLEHFEDSGLQVSFFDAWIDLAQGTITYAGGGHPSPLLLRQPSPLLPFPSGRGVGGEGPLPTGEGLGVRVEPLKSQNMLLGVREECPGEEPEHCVEAAAGDRVLLFTDGLPETKTLTPPPSPSGRGGRGEGITLLGEAGLVEIAKDLCVGSVFEVADCILQRVAELRTGPATDDLTLIVAEWK